MPLEHLHQRSACHPAVEILDEVHKSYESSRSIHWSTHCWDHEKVQAFKALEQSNTHSQMTFVDWSLFLIGCIYWLVSVSDWLDSLIGPSGLLLVVSHLLAVQFQFYRWVFGKEWVTKTWMWGIFLQGHVLSVGGDALIYMMYYIPANKLYAGWYVTLV